VNRRILRDLFQTVIGNRVENLLTKFCKKKPPLPFGSEGYFYEFCWSIDFIFITVKASVV